MADKVDITLDINAVKVIQTLNEVNKLADTASGKAQLLKKNLMDLSRATGTAPQKLLKDLQALQGQVVKGSPETFEGFKTPKFGVDVTDDVFQETAALLEADKALNKYATADAKAASANKNFDGSVKQVNTSLGEQKTKLQVLNAELNKLKSPPQGRTTTGQFTAATPPSFATQFAGLATYQQQLKLVETTISNLQKKTNLPFKDIGRELGKSFPELLKDTNLVNTAVTNLTKKNQGLSASFRTEAEAIKLVENRLTELQRKGALNIKGFSKQGAVDQLKSVISQVSQETGAQYKQVGDAMARMGIPAGQAQAAVRGLNKELTHGVKEAKVFAHGIDIVRTALGTLVAVGVFGFIQFLTQSFKTAVKAARDLEDSLFRLSNVERILSEAGIETSMKGLQKGIQEIKKLFPIFSEEDVTQLVAQIAISTKDLGYTEEQILELAKAVSILNIRSTEEETASQTAQKVLSSLITDNAKGISGLGLSFRDIRIQLKAIELGFIKAGESAAELTEQERAQVKYALSIENTADELNNINEYMATNTARMKQNSAAWQDLLATIGQLFLPFIPVATSFFSLLNDGFKVVKTGAAIFLTLGTAFLTVFRMGIDNFVELVNVVRNGGLPTLFESISKGGIKNFTSLGSVLEDVGNKAKKMFGNMFFPAGIPSDAPNWFKEFFGDALEKTDTPTEPIVDASESEIDTSGLDELSEKLQDISIDAQHAREDLAVLLEQKQEDLEIDFQFKLADLDTEYIQKAEDAAIDYGQKIEDINLDAQQKIEDAKRKAREEEEKAEAEFLLRMKHLRMDFLLDLDDALHARDARQVLRLIKEYNNDKQKLIDKKALDDQFRQESLEAELENIEIERQRKLESAAIEYQRKLEQLAVAKQREIEELNRWKQREEEELALWYQRELEEIDRNTQQKIERLLAGYIEEGKIHEEQQAKIHGILVKWFGQNRALVDSLMAYTAQAFSGMAAMAASALSFASMSLPQGQPAPYWQMAAQTAGGLAAGGQFVATKPTSALFGEGGEPELVTVTPLSKLASLRGKQPINGVDGLDGRNGQQRIVLDMNLSPDLEARVVERAMDGTAEVIQKVNRSK